MEGIKSGIPYKGKTVSLSREKLWSKGNGETIKVGGIAIIIGYYIGILQIVAIKPTDGMKIIISSVLYRQNK